MRTVRVAWSLLLALGVIQMTAGADDREVKVGQLVAALVAEPHGGWNRYAEEVAVFGEDAVEPLAVVLADPGSTPWTRRKVAWTLGMTGAAGAVTPLVAALADPDGHVRLAAGAALADLGEPAVPALVRVLGTRREVQREAAARALGRIDSDASTAALEGVLDDPNDGVRRNAGLALGHRGRESAGPALVEVLADGGGWHAVVAAHLLGELRVEMAVPHLVVSLASDDWQLRIRAADALVAIGSDRVEELLEAAASAPPRQRRWAVSVLGRLRASAAVGVVLTALESPDWMLREEAAVALARIGHPAEADVRRLAEHLDPAVRREVEWIEQQWAGATTGDSHSGQRQ